MTAIPKHDKSLIAFRRRVLRDENKRWSAQLVHVPRDQWPPEAPRDGCAPIAVWRSSSMLVQIWNERAGWTRISVTRAAIADDGEWLDGLTWDELQAVKRAVGYGDMDAVEIYPPDSDVVNVANIRHLWISPEPLDFIWRDRKDTQ
jgi:hypothetical protein